jgi:hypothetical protein
MATADDVVPVEPQKDGLQNSPIEMAAPAVSGPAAPSSASVCLWNGQEFGPGARVCSVGVVLQCSGGGRWVQTGERC